MTYSIRDILLVTVIAALAVAWWIDHRRLSAHIDRDRRKLEELANWVESEEFIRHLGIGELVTDGEIPND